MHHLPSVAACLYLSVRLAHAGTWLCVGPDGIVVGLVYCLSLFVVSVISNTFDDPLSVPCLPVPLTVQ